MKFVLVCLIQPNETFLSYLKYSKTKLYPGSVASYNTRPGNEVGLFYNAREPTRGHSLYKHAHMWTKAKSTEVVKCSVVELLE